MAAVLSLLIGTSTCMPAAAGSGRSMLQQARDYLLFAAVDIDHLHICACSLRASINAACKTDLSLILAYTLYARNSNVLHMHKLPCRRCRTVPPLQQEEEED